MGLSERILRYLSRPWRALPTSGFATVASRSLNPLGQESCFQAVVRELKFPPD
jgi:hypothetical protein